MEKTLHGGEQQLLLSVFIWPALALMKRLAAAQAPHTYQCRINTNVAKSFWNLLPGSVRLHRLCSPVAMFLTGSHANEHWPSLRQLPDGRITR